MTVPMAIVDIVPVALFAISSAILQKMLYGRMKRNLFSLFASGTVMIVVSGAYKALWKLLYALNVCDFTVLNKMFFPLQTTGFVLAAVALVMFAAGEKGGAGAIAAAAPAVYNSSMIFVIFTVMGTLGVCGSLAVISKRLKRNAGVVLFILAFVFMLAMGYLSSRDFTKASINWIGQFTNIAGQGCFLAGVCQLKKAGLGD